MTGRQTPRSVATNRQRGCEPTIRELPARGSGPVRAAGASRGRRVLAGCDTGHPGWAQVIRFVKWWAKQHKDADPDFKFKSFMAELIAAHLLDAGVSFTDHAAALDAFLEYRSALSCGSASPSPTTSRRRRSRPAATRRSRSSTR